jgi:repressor of nif and glnA expression
MVVKEESLNTLSVEDGSTRKEIEILRVLSEYNEPVGSTLLARELRKKGFLLSERTVRYHLQLLELKGLAEGHARNGRMITAQGLRELTRAMAYYRMGFITTRYLSMACAVTYHPNTCLGEVVVNVSMVEKGRYNDVLGVVELLREKQLLTAPYIKILEEGEEYRNIYVPEGQLALFTVCDLAIDGILLNLGIPILFKYGGLVQFVNNQPVRFVDLISYAGTTIPPLEVFLYRNTTSILSMVQAGSGMIPASLREIPATTREKAEEILEYLKKQKWHGVLKFGRPNESILGVPVAMDRVGLSMVGDLTPAALLREMGAKTVSPSSHCLIPIEEMTQI